MKLNMINHFPNPPFAIEKNKVIEGSSFISDLKPFLVG